MGTYNINNRNKVVTTATLTIAIAHDAKHLGGHIALQQHGNLRPRAFTACLGPEKAAGSRTSCLLGVALTRFLWWFDSTLVRMFPFFSTCTSFFCCLLLLVLTVITTATTSTTIAAAARPMHMSSGNRHSSVFLERI